MIQKYKVLYLLCQGESIYEIIRGEMPEGLALETLSSGQRSEVLSKLPDADFVIVTNMDKEMIAAAPKLKLIQMAGVGVDGVDLEAATRAGIPVAQTVQGTIIGVAEHTLLLMLALYKHLVELDASVRRGEWPVWQFRPSSYTLSGKTVGILGLGRIGREVAKRCRGFGTQVCYFDEIKIAVSLERELGVQFLPLNELLSNSDIVSLHVPLTPQTRHFFGETQFRRMKPSAIFINTARGEIVDETALIRALQEGWIAGAGLDVLALEPPDPTNPLLRMRNTIFSPHIATGTRDSIIQKTHTACENFLRVLSGDRPINVVNQEVYDEGRLHPLSP